MRLLFFFLLIPSLAFAVAPDAPTNVAVDMTPNWVEDETFPFRVYDKNYGDWMVEIAIGNMSTKMDWYDAPAEETGFVKPQMCADGPIDSGKYYCAIAPSMDWPVLIEYDYATKVARLLLDKNGLVEGDSQEAMAGYPFYNSYDDSVYLMGRGACIRKLVDDLDGTYSVELVSGNCDERGDVDGNKTTSRYGWSIGAANDVSGNIWIMDSYSGAKFKVIDTSGNATTLADVTRDDGGVVSYAPLNSPWQIPNLTQGRDSTHLHVTDSYTGSGVGWSAQRINVSTHAMTRIAGFDFVNLDTTYKRKAYGGVEKDGPALTHALVAAGGRGALYSKFYDSIILSGQDNASIQRYDYVTDWVTLAGHIPRPFVTKPTGAELTDEELYDSPHKSEYGALDPGYTKIPQLVGTDRYGGIYYTHAGDNKKIYRTFNPTLGGLALGDIQ